MLPECERRFALLEKQQESLQKDYVSDMEMTRKDVSEFGIELKDLRKKVDTTHDSVIEMSKDISFISKIHEEEKKAREKELEERKREKENERLERKNDRKWIIGIMITSSFSLIGLIITIIKMF